MVIICCRLTNRLISCLLQPWYKYVVAKLIYIYILNECRYRFIYPYKRGSNSTHIRISRQLTETEEIKTHKINNVYIFYNKTALKLDYKYNEASQKENLVHSLHRNVLYRRNCSILV